MSFGGWWIKTSFCRHLWLTAEPAGLFRDSFLSPQRLYYKKQCNNKDISASVRLHLQCRLDLPNYRETIWGWKNLTLSRPSRIFHPDGWLQCGGQSSIPDLLVWQFTFYPYLIFDECFIWFCVPILAALKPQCYAFLLRHISFKWRSVACTQKSHFFLKKVTHFYDRDFS